MKLGCLNHALLTAESIRARGATLAGWVGTRIDPRMPASDDNLAALAELIGAPCIGVVPWLERLVPRVLGGYLHPERWSFTGAAPGSVTAEFFGNVLPH